MSHLPVRQSKSEISLRSCVKHILSSKDREYVVHKVGTGVQMLCFDRIFANILSKIAFERSINDMGCITYVNHAHPYNEGGRGVAPTRATMTLQSFTDWAGKDILLILSVFTKILHLCRICVDCI